jgi:hypothetical protein
MKSTEQLVLGIQEIFGKSRPNGILLGWDKNRFFSSLRELCADCTVVNDTDFNYSYCNSFEIVSNTNRQEHDYVITFKTSFVLDVYSLHVTRYSPDRKRSKVVSEHECTELIPILQRIRNFAEKQYLQEISSSDHDVVVDGVSLELSEVATVGKCLFDDFE